MTRRCAGVAFAVALACASCGNEPKDERTACERFAACGGDPVGVWRARELCASGGIGTLYPSLPDECRRAFTVRSGAADATLTIGADGSVTEGGGATITWQMEADASCVEAFTETPANAEVISGFCDAFPDALTTEDSAFTGATCMSSSDMCFCDAEAVSNVVSDVQVEVVGTELVTPGGERSSFCVDGDELAIERVLGDLRMVTVFRR